MVDKFCKFVKIKLIHQLNHNNFFEHLNHTTKLSQNCLNQTGGGVHAGSKEKNVVGVLGGGGGGGGCFGSLVGDKSSKFIKNRIPREMFMVDE